MAGNKNSGRRTVWDERHKVQAINTLWKKVNQKIQENEELTEYEEKLVLSVLPKTIQTQTDITSGGDKVIPILGGQTNALSTNNSDREADEAK